MLQKEAEAYVACVGVSSAAKLQSVVGTRTFTGESRSGNQESYCHKGEGPFHGVLPSYLTLRAATET